MRIPRRASARAAPAVLAGALLAACSAPMPQPAPAATPEAPPGTKTGIVSSAHPLTTRAGVEALERGGTAVDAAIAVQAMLGLVEPQSSGLAGGAFLLHHLARDGHLDAYIGRKRAPGAATPSMFLDRVGDPLPRSQVMLGGRATTTP